MRVHPNFRIVALVSALLAACDHSVPFQPGAYGPDGPLVPGSIVRLTYNPGQDLIPVWLRDGSGIVYTAERPDRADHDRCFAFMPVGGGAVSRYACRTTVSDDSVNVFEEAAPGVNGQMAYVRASSTRGLSRLAPDAQEFVTAPMDMPVAAQPIFALPFITAWGEAYDAVTAATWLDSTRLVFVGQHVSYPALCKFCARDTVKTGVELAMVTFSGDQPVLTLLPGTTDASSVSVGATGDTIYFTRVGDSRVFRYAVSNGQTDTVFDFGALGIARDVSVANGRLAATVGGAVQDSTDAFLGRMQSDHGGNVFVVMLANGALIQIGNANWRFRRPALSPDGTRLIVSALDGSSTAADLWSFDLP